VKNCKESRIRKQEPCRGRKKNRQKNVNIPSAQTEEIGSKQERIPRDQTKLGGGVNNRGEGLCELAVEEILSKKET